MLAILNQRQLGTLLSNTIQNLKNNGHCLAITIQSYLSTIDPPIPTDEVPKTDGPMVDKTSIIKTDKTTGVNAGTKEDKDKGKVTELKIREIP